MAEDLLVEIALTEGKYNAELRRLESNTVRAARKSEKAFVSANKSIGHSFIAANAGANAFAGHGMRNVAMQLSQVAQQGSATGNYLQALAIQLPDLALGFGTIGIAAGVAAGALLPLVANMISSGESSVDLETALDDLAKAITDYERLAKTASLSTEEMDAKFGSAASSLKAAVDLLAQIGADKAQRAIDQTAESLANLLGTSGAGDVRAELADFFDVNIFLAFTEAQRQARGEARELTAEFVNTQDALRGMNGNLDEQIAATQTLLEVTTQLANANGEVSDEEQEIISQIATALEHMISLKEATEAAAGSTKDMGEDMGSAREQAEFLEKSINTIRDAIDGAAASAMAFLNIDGAPPWVESTIRQLAALQEWVASMAAPVGVSGYQGGRGGDPRQMGGGAKDWQTNDPAAQLAYSGQRGTPSYVPPKVGGGRSSGGGGGGGGSDPLLADAKRVFEETRTEAEKYATAVTELQTLLAGGYITQDTYNRALEMTADKYGEVAAAGEQFEELNNMLKDSILDFAENGVDAMDGLAKAIKRAAIEALLFNQGPLAALLGGGAGSKGLLGGLLSFDGGGFTGGGVRAGGIDGKGGFPAILHPNETIIDHSKGGGGGGGSMTIFVRPSADLIAEARSAGEQRSIQVVQENNRKVVPRIANRQRTDPRRIG